MTVQSTAIVPFGKYKGQPAEVLANDPSYIQWLLAQDWFRDRYANIYNIIINNGSEPTESPEHNALQVLFLDEEFCFRLACYTHEKLRTVIADGVDPDIYVHRMLETRWPEWGGLLPKHGPIVDAIIHVTLSRDGYCKEYTYGGKYRYADEKTPCDIASAYFGVEIKPSVSDDYPAVLRQMQANGSSVLFTRGYTGVGATRTQFIEFFRLADRCVVFLDDFKAWDAQNPAAAFTRCSDKSSLRPISTPPPLSAPPY